MSAFRVIIMPRASRDLELIHGHIGKDSPLNADGMVRRILDAMEPLKTFPSRMIVIGQRAGLRDPVRKVSVKPYIIYFRLVEQKHLVEILHVRHGAKRPPKRVI